MYYKIAPTDLTFLLDDCPACFYRKVKLGVRRPYSPFPSVFSKIDSGMKGYFHGKSTYSWGMPEGSIDAGSHSLKSSPLHFGGTQVVFSGRPDAIAQFTNGAWGLFDFKTSEAKDSQIELYKRQLHCGRGMMQCPAKGDVRWVEHLGLFVVVPGSMREENGKAVFDMNLSYQEIAVDDPWWQDFMGGIVRLLDGEPPKPKDGCFYCELHELRERGEKAIAPPPPEPAPVLSSFSL